MSNRKHLPAIGAEVMANVREVGYRRLVLVSGSDADRSYFLMYKNGPSWFCKADNCFYDVNLVDNWIKAITKNVLKF